MIPAPNEDGSASSGSLGLVHPSLPPKPIATAQSTRSVSYEDAVSRSWISDTPPRFDSTPWSFFPISQTPSASLMNKDASHNVPTGFSYTGNRGRKGGRSVNDIPRRSKRTGGPPKAILGGVGGKTFDEMMVEKANGKTQARRSSPGLVHVGSQDRLDKPSAGYTDISGVRVSSDTAAEPLRLTTDYNGTVSERARRNKLVSNRRKGSVASTTDSEEGSSAKYATKDTQQLVHAANSDATPSWRGKEVLVRLPREDGWVSLFSRAEEVKSRRESAEGENKLRQVEKAVDQESTSASTLLVPSQQSSVETGTGEMPRHEVISKGRFGNSAYLKRSLGGILKEGTLKTTPSRTQRRAVSDLFPAQNMEPDEPEKLGSLEDTTASGNGQQTSPTFQGSHFEDISLSSMTTSRDGPTDRAGRVQLSDGERTPRLIGKPESLIGEAGSQSLTYNSDLLTIIPAKPRRRGTLDLQLSEKVSSPARDGSTSQHEAHHQDSKQSGGLHTSAAAYHSSPLGKDLSAHPLHPSSAGTSTEATREPAGEQKQIISLRANAPIWAPMAQSRSISVGSSKTSGLSDLESDGGNSIGTSETDILSPIKQPTLIPPPKLRPTADPFVPVFATETNMVSTAHPVEASKRLVYGSEGDTTDNPVSLRPLVTAFAPAYASGDYRQREGGQARLLGSSGAEGNGRLVPDTFRFVPKLRPTAAAFTPSSFGQKQSAVVDSQISPAATSSQRSLARSSCTGATLTRSTGASAIRNKS
ncbi:hypothetical protein BD324DRAFT_369078 [Kockovaella imperatae]|uniref:Uncharacterized protein n=1 Tax=Kockovaella imperatae TaxID=4999 RepID=A0A1Y1UKT1_9TREE|nr:hypothetical protein BD324DRAFT_369078 [Kockovaella imperatae]ORX38599.1 hypothetical protein BD324DRAFT_369078 [Kockovaella imperatae]